MAADQLFRIISYFKDYSESHQSRGNRFCQFVGVPILVIALLGLLGRFSIYALSGYEWLRLDGGTLLWGIVLLWYLFLDWKIAIPFGLFSLGLYFIGRAVPLAGLWALFIGGVIIQYVGYWIYEKRFPALCSCFRQAFIAPLWVFSRWVGYLI